MRVRDTIEDLVYLRNLLKELHILVYDIYNDENVKRIDIGKTYLDNIVLDPEPIGLEVLGVRIYLKN